MSPELALSLPHESPRDDAGLSTQPDAEEEGHEVLSVSLTKEQDDASVAIINTLAPAECKAPKEAAVEFMDRFAGTLPWLSQKSAYREI
jgi:hypothetical protein